MKLFNFKAFSKKTELDSRAMIAAEELENFINDLQANKTMYHCTFDVENRPSLVGYEGMLRPVFDTIHFDLDSKGDEGALAWEQTKALCLRLIESGCPFQLYFSGNKGFHVAIHKSALGIDQGPKAELEASVKALYYSLKAEFSTVDAGIWNATRKFRAYRSQHEETGLYKIRLTDIGIKPSALSIHEIRNLALAQPVHKYAHPEACAQPIEWLTSLIKSTTHQNYESRKKGSTKEVPQGEIADDDSLKFKTFKPKKCIERMKDEVLPGCNRHDVGLRITQDLFYTGVKYEKAKELMGKWAVEQYGSDTDRIKDTDRITHDIYHKPQEYEFGCYDKIRMLYCSGKCKIYDAINPKLRAENIDCTKAQKAQNEMRRNPLIELSEGEIADKILAELPSICVAQETYFRWIETHWERLDGDRFQSMLKKLCIKAYKNKEDIHAVESLYRHILAKIEVAPDTNHFFNCSPNKFNFLDGTAVISKSLEGKLSLSFKPHDMADCLAYCAPFPLFAEHKLPKSDALKHYMETRIEDVGHDGIRVIKQMLGAALIPYVPRIFFIEGKTNSGKSTLALLIKRLLGNENVSEIQPVIKGGGADRFNWETSIGKLANIILELEKGTPLDVNTLKMVRDKTSISVDRKGKSHVKATLPYLHIYCCNQMPPSLEGNSGALNNRVSMLEFKPGYLNGLSTVSELADFIWDTDAGSLLELAREGLQDLMDSDFKYYESDASKASVTGWQKLNDPLTLFIEDIKNGEYSATGLEGKEWEKGSQLYVAFCDWATGAGKKGIMGKHVFYKNLKERLGFELDPRGKGGVLVRWNVPKSDLRPDCDQNLC